MEAPNVELAAHGQADIAFVAQRGIDLLAEHLDGAPLFVRIRFGDARWLSRMRFDGAHREIES